VDQLFNSSEKRLARILLLLANFGKEGRPEPVVPKVSQETLAEMVGATRSRVSLFMNKFRKLGFIEYNGTIYLYDLTSTYFEGAAARTTRRPSAAIRAIIAPTANRS
jgi:DNA-binding IclR family transcriptional regulator